MKKILTLLLLALALSASALERPRLVVGIVVDQMRWDYLYRYYDLYGEGGFKRLMNQGFSCEDLHINYIPSITAVGHASVFTGTTPSVHGIASNSFMKDGQYVYCCEDHDVNPVGTTDRKTGCKSARNELSSTIGDEIIMAQDYKAKVVGVSLKDRAAIFPAGHAATGAFWYDDTVCGFITSSYYMNELPQWVSRFNAGVPKKKKNDVWGKPFGNHLTKEMAKAAIEGEQLGMSSTMDMLTINFACTDVIAHEYGTHAPETQEVYTELDKELTEFFSFLDSKYGRDGYLLFLTADHGGAENPWELIDHNIPGGGWDGTAVRKDLNRMLRAKYGLEKDLVQRILSYQIVLERKYIIDNGISLEDVKQTIIDYLRYDTAYAYIVDLEKAAQATIPDEIRQKIINGYNRHRGGDIQLILQPGYMLGYTKRERGTSHGVWNPYDCHLPLIMMGWHITPGKTSQRVNITDIAPTVCSLIHVQMPSGCVGHPITAITK